MRAVCEQVDNTLTPLGAGSGGVPGSYHVTVQPGAASALRTHLADATVFTGVVGVLHTLDIRAKDEYGNVVTTTDLVWGFGAGNPYIVPAAVQGYITGVDAALGLFRAKWMGTVAETYAVSIELGGDVIRRSSAGLNEPVVVCFPHRLSLKEPLQPFRYRR